ncbi:hypothetical protein K4K57_010659 [Colletotrichum sp. SAR 10_99]|nr:hypothetical protein K4K55_012394 [Colletotrichum sp. SAR 10_96]KAJ5016774.1 hypothetical protein K4K57_010659 [Colletotrichum sp. SAR 10_99]
MIEASQARTDRVENPNVWKFVPVCLSFFSGRMYRQNPGIWVPADVAFNVVVAAHDDVSKWEARVQQDHHKTTAMTEFEMSVKIICAEMFLDTIPGHDGRSLRAAVMNSCRGDKKGLGNAHFAIRDVNKARKKVAEIARLLM